MFEYKKSSVFVVSRVCLLDLASFDLNMGFYTSKSPVGTLPYVWKPNKNHEHDLPNFFRHQYRRLHNNSGTWHTSNACSQPTMKER